MDGLTIHEATEPGTTVAMTAAGNIAYFARRTAVDMLGKSDHVGGGMVGRRFTPDHTGPGMTDRTGQAQVPGKTAP